MPPLSGRLRHDYALPIEEMIEDCFAFRFSFVRVDLMLTYIYLDSVNKTIFVPISKAASLIS